MHELGYVMIHAPGHPRAHKKGYVFEHILVAEHALGRFIPRKAQVHHVNEIKTENQGSNLVICENQAYHALLHQRALALKETGSVHSRRCVYCKQWSTPEQDKDMKINVRNWRHRACHAEYEYRRLNK